MCNIKVRRGLVGLMVIGLCMLVSTPIHANGNALIGEYGFTGTNGCLTCDSGFSEDGFLFPLGDPYLVTGSVYGIIKFNRDGTGVGKGKMVAVRTYPPFNGGEFIKEFTIPFTYTFNHHEGTITMSGDGYGIWTKGAVEVPFTMSHWSYTGTVSPDHKTLIVTTAVPEVETITTTPDSPKGYQICHRSWILIQTH
jgi:hypothetical protein